MTVVLLVSWQPIGPSLLSYTTVARCTPTAADVPRVLFSRLSAGPYRRNIKPVASLHNPMLKIVTANQKGIYKTTYDSIRLQSHWWISGEGFPVHDALFCTVMNRVWASEHCLSSLNTGPVWSSPVTMKTQRQSKQHNCGCFDQRPRLVFKLAMAIAGFFYAENIINSAIVLQKIYDPQLVSLDIWFAFLCASLDVAMLICFFFLCGFLYRFARDTQRLWRSCTFKWQFVIECTKGTKYV